MMTMMMMMMMVMMLMTIQSDDVDDDDGDDDDDDDGDDADDDKDGRGMTMRGGRRGEEERGALLIQNEDPTPQDGWEKTRDPKEAPKGNA